MIAPSLQYTQSVRYESICLAINSMRQEQKKGSEEISSAANQTRDIQTEVDELKNRKVHTTIYHSRPMNDLLIVRLYGVVNNNRSYR